MKIAFQVDDKVVEAEVAREDGLFVVRVGETAYRVDALKLEGDLWSLLIDGRSYDLSVDRSKDTYVVRHGAAEKRLEVSDPGRRARAAAAGAGGADRIVSVMPGKVTRVLVAEGDEVVAGQGIVVVEAMKMENEIATTRAGKVTRLAVEAGQAVEANAELAVVE